MDSLKKYEIVYHDSCKWFSYPVARNRAIERRLIPKNAPIPKNLLEYIEVYNWLFENVKGTWTLYEDRIDGGSEMTLMQTRYYQLDSKYLIEFTDPDDAMLFRLTWSGAVKES
jgi:hypothetical protein